MKMMTRVHMQSIRRQIRRLLPALILAVSVLGSDIPVCAAPRRMTDGGLFDPEFYAAAYPDVRAAFGTDPQALYRHYQVYGIREGRLPYAAGNFAVAAQTAAVNTIAASKSQRVKLQRREIEEEQLQSPYLGITHDYYSGISSQGRKEADTAAAVIADDILANTSYTTDYDRVSAAAQTVAYFCGRNYYAVDEEGIAYTAYGALAGGVSNGTGAALALGRILEFMGYPWYHSGANSASHQWVLVYMDGQLGYADGLNGNTGFGIPGTGMSVPGGGIVIFP